MLMVVATGRCPQGSRAAAPPSPHWEQLAVESSPEEVLIRACLYAPCRSRMSARSAVELTSMLPGIGAAGNGMAKVRAVLRTSTLVRETWRGRWQVGGCQLPSNCPTDCATLDPNGPEAQEVDLAAR